MRLLSTVLQAFVKTGGQAASFAVSPAGMIAVTELLSTVIVLCDSVPQNKSAARQLADRCRRMCQALKQYEVTDLPDRADEYRVAVFKCLENVRVKMATWAHKSWLHMLLHQGDFEVDISNCNASISDCLATLMAATNLESLAWQKEDEKWKRDLSESLDADHQAFMKLLSSVTLVQQAADSKLTESQSDMRKLLNMIQKGLAEDIGSQEEHDRMASNLYELLRLSNELPPQRQLDSGEVEWTGKVPVGGSRNVDIYRGLYLKRENVTIKVIRSVKKDEESINRVRREIELWAKMYAIDKGRHIIPFYGFCTTDGIRLALISPWIPNGDALTYVKMHDRLVNYRKLIRGIADGIGVLHMMVPPIIHGELKAAKVLIGGEGQPLLTDFALSKLEGNLITQSVGVSDAYRWYAPEMCSEAGTVSASSDIYSFGMTILELLTHEKPYSNIVRGVRVIQKMEKGILPDRPSDPRVLERGLDDRMWENLNSCWSFVPEVRPSINELIAILGS
jgi:serine/threonine protein kinase